MDLFSMEIQALVKTPRRPAERLANVRDIWLLIIWWSCMHKLCWWISVKPVILLEKNPDSERYAEGSRVAFSCSFQMNNVFVRAEVEDISWFKDGTIIKNASFPSGRIFVLNSELQNDKVWSTQLIVTNARPYDGGNAYFVCSIRFIFMNNNLYLTCI